MWRRSISKIPLDRGALNFFPIGSTQYFRRAVFELNDEHGDETWVLNF